MMTKTIKHTFHTIGDQTGDLARAVGQVGKSQDGPSIDEACETSNRQLV